MKINILDPGLKHTGGHHYDWNVRIARSLVARGHEVSVYGNMEADPGALEGFDGVARIERLFRFQPYRTAESFDPICGEIERQIAGTQLTAQDLRKVVEADLWFWPTFFAHQLSACAINGSKAAISGCIHMSPERISTASADPGPWWRLGVKNIMSTNRSIRTIGATDADCVAAFRPYLRGLNPVTLPVAVDGHPVRRDSLSTIGFFGAHMRDEQGAALVPALIGQCVQAGFKVVTQAGEALPPDLRAHPRVTMLNREGDFVPKAEACDLIVTPYEWIKYINRGSGTLWQAMASGIPCVAPYGASPTRVLAQIGSVSIFGELSVNGVMTAILRARDDYARLAGSAYRGALDWRKNQGTEKFVSVMLGE